jgi:choline dehydrogenase-like flavoprotein
VRARGRSAEVIVVGAGPAGVVVADALREAGVRARILEAGPRLSPGAPAPPIDGDAWAYAASPKPIEWMRVRALGGRALLWGGWAQRFPEVALRDGGWPYGARTLAPWYRAAEARTEVAFGKLDARYRKAARALELVASPKRGMRRDARPWTPADVAIAREVETGTVALAIESEGSRARALRVLDRRTSETRTLDAKAIVLAASTIETTRILLASARAAAHPRIGRGLVDHVIVGFVLIEPRPAPSPEGRGVFPGAAVFDRFVNLGDRRTRRPYRGGFCLEVDGPHPLELIAPEEQARLGIDRFDPLLHGFTLIHAIGETFPHPRRRVALDPSARDALGRAVPRLSFVWTDDDRAMAADMRHACLALADALAPPGSTLIPSLDSIAGRLLAHEAGTCAMGVDEDAACDPWGRLRALEGVWVADGAAMPTSGDRHPSLTLLAHAHRVAHDVARAVG